MQLHVTALTCVPTCCGFWLRTSEHHNMSLVEARRPQDVRPLQAVSGHSRRRQPTTDDVTSAERIGSVSSHQPQMDTVARELTQLRSPSILFFTLSSAVRSHRTACGTGRWGVCVREVLQTSQQKKTQQTESPQHPNQHTTQRSCASMFAVSAWTRFAGLGRIRG